MALNMKIISGIDTNEDSYQWKDLNCFYKPIFIIHKKYSDFSGHCFLALISAYNIFNLSFPKKFANYYNEELSQIFDLYIEKKQFDTKEQFIDDIVNNLTNDNPVFVEVDLFHVYYDFQYLEAHASHYIPIKGFNIKKRLFYCLDTLHNKDYGPIYNDDVITFDLLWEMYAHKEYYVFKCKENNQSIKHKIKLVFHHLEELFLKNHITEDALENVENVYYNNMRRVYYNELFYVLESICKDQNVLITLREYRKQIEDAWKKCRCASIYNECSSRNRQSINQYQDLIDTEQEFHQILFQLVGTNIFKDFSVKKEQVLYYNNIPYAIVNKHDRKIVVTSDEITMENESDCASNIWTTDNFAPQLVFDHGGMREFTFSVEVESVMEDVKSTEYMDGFYIMLKDGTRIAFGNFEDDKLIFYCDEYDEFVKIKRKSNVLFYRAIVRKDGITFDYKESGEDEYTNAYTIVPHTSIKNIVIFSRTWMPINHIAKFRKIELSNIETNKK